METKPFNIKLTVSEREGLEAHRAALGLRSHAEVVRHWISQSPHDRAADNGRLVATQTVQMPSGDTVSFGPVKAKPGDRLKKPKG